MGQLYYAQTQLYSTVLGGENQRTVRIKHRDPLLTSRSSSFRFFSQILYQGPNHAAHLHAWVAWALTRDAGAQQAFAVSYTTSEQDTQNIPEEQDYKPTGY